MDGKKLRKGINIILTVLFLCAIFLVGGMTIATEGSGMYDAVRLKTKLRPYLPEDPNALDYLNARFRSLESYLSENLWANTELKQISANFQHALGKQMISLGSAQMITLTNGVLYDLQGEFDVQNSVDTLAGLQDTLPEGTQFLFMYIHPALYEDTLIPDGYEIFDESDKMADQIVEGMREAGVDTIDTRDFLSDSGYSMNDLLLRTDQHWTALAALLSTKPLAQEISALTGTQLDSSRLDVSQFDSYTYPSILLGKNGKRVGVNGWVALDDYTVYWPKYDTNITRYSVNASGGGDETASGSFYDAVIRWNAFDTDENGISENAYCAYGLIEKYEHYHNDNAPEIKILMLKDSFAAPVSAFLSLVASDVYTSDLRWPASSYSKILEDIQPDIVVLAYSQNMLRDGTYQFD